MDKKEYIYFKDKLLYKIVTLLLTRAKSPSSIHY